VAAAPLLFLLGLTAVSGWVPSRDGLGLGVTIASLAGLVAPVLGYRLYLWQQERIPDDADGATRCAHYLRAVTLALSATELSALFGVAMYALTRRPFALAGVLTHVLLSGALWPTPEKLEPFLDGRPGSAA
jgi:hypothetical protein